MEFKATKGMFKSERFSFQGFSVNPCRFQDSSSFGSSSGAPLYLKIANSCTYYKNAAKEHSLYVVISEKIIMRSSKSACHLKVRQVQSKFFACTMLMNDLVHFDPESNFRDILLFLLLLFYILCFIQKFHQHYQLKRGLHGKHLKN